MKIPIDVKVECTNGAAGHTAAIIINPAARQVTHIVVKGKGDLVGEFLVPLDMIDQATPYALILRLSREKLEAETRFDKTILTDQSGDLVGNDLLMYSGSDNVNLGAVSLPTYVQVEQIPGSAIALHIGAHVDAVDGRVGKMDEIIINRDTGDIDYITLRHGHLWGKKEICVPIADVDHIVDDIVQLKLDKAGIEALPVLPKY